MQVQRLLPDPGPTTVDAELSDLQLSAKARDGRPYVVLNMVESIDGRATVGGRVGALTGPVDQQIVYQLRTQADALLVGAGTVRNERYGNIVPPEHGDHRPLVVIVTRRVDLPADLPLLNEPDTRIVVATSADATLEFDHAASVEYVCAPGPDGGVDTTALMARLGEDYGVRSIVCEGGPTLNESLLAQSLVDELFLSLSPLLVSGAERSLADATEGHPVIHARLLSALTADSYLFLRYEL